MGSVRVRGNKKPRSPSVVCTSLTHTGGPYGPNHERVKCEEVDVLQAGKHKVLKGQLGEPLITQCFPHVHFDGTSLVTETCLEKAAEAGIQ